jgi:glycosyltransferase involved in cell wall biosynthesis
LSARFSIIIPAHEEGEDILTTLSRISETIVSPFECLVIVDRAEDSTVVPVRQFMTEHENFRVEINSGGIGLSSAIAYGVRISKAKIIVIFMADGCDNPQDIESMVGLVEKGASIVCASRYMRTGKQIGAPFVKSNLSRLAGISLFKLGRVGTHDATNNFKAYRRSFLMEVGIDSSYGFEIGIEMIAKAKRRNEKVMELPTTWIEKRTSQSNFKFFRFSPKYLYWYLYALGLFK